MDGTILRNRLESLLPEATITAAVLATGFQQRQRKLDPVALVRALVLSGGTPDGGRQADALRATWVVGSEFDGQLQGGGDVRLGKTRAFDIDVTVGPDKDPIPVRMVGVPSERGYCTFLTTLPRSTHSLHDVGVLYRLRWTIEIDNKLAKSACRLDHVEAETTVSALILIHAAMIASILANAIVHADHLAREASGMRTLRLQVAPLHPMLVAKMVAQMADRLAVTMADSGATSAEWDRFAALIQHVGKDPNWRRRASAIDRVKGRVVTHGRPRAQRSVAGSAQNA